MKTYTVIYAEDVPHYAQGEVRARGPKDVIPKAKKLDTDSFTAFDADWSNSVCRRIVEITDEETGETVANDIRLDTYSLERGTDEELKLREHAAELAKNLQALIAKADGVISAADSGSNDFETEIAALSDAASAAEKTLEHAGYITTDTEEPS